MSSNLLEVVEEVARAAGDAARERGKAGLEVEIKPDGSPVTVADRHAESVARALIEERFPTYGILGEEFGIVRPEARRRFILDPIDGTKAFVRGVPLWGTLVAIAEGDDVLAGALYLPALGEMLVAERGRGCFANGVRAQVSACKDMTSATILATEPDTFAVARTPLPASVRRTWGDCYGYALVATGRAEAMIDRRVSAWDTAALAPIIEEAGGVFTDLEGRRTAFGSSAIATNRALAEEVRRAFSTPKASGPALDLRALDFEKGGGKVTVVTVDAWLGTVLMVAQADRAALERTLETGDMHYTSRTRGLWHKGAMSGNVQRVLSLHPDCDGDVLLARVESRGPACHEGTASCFGNQPHATLTSLDKTVAERSAGAEQGYTGRLLADGNLRLKKIGEEATELVMALATKDGRRAVEEAADLTYHMLVGLRGLGLGLSDLARSLESRKKPSDPIDGE